MPSISHSKVIIKRFSLCPLFSAIDLASANPVADHFNNIFPRNFLSNDLTVFAIIDPIFPMMRVVSFVVLPSQTVTTALLFSLNRASVTLKVFRRRLELYHAEF